VGEHMDTVLVDVLLKSMDIFGMFIGHVLGIIYALA
jgi:hypothetical protein